MGQPVTTVPTDYTNAENQFINAHELKREQASSLQNMIDNATGSVEQRFMMMMMLLGGMAELPGNNVNIASSEMNGATAVSGLINQIANEVNSFSTTNSANNTQLANQIVAQCQQLQAILQQGNVTWTNPATGEEKTSAFIPESTVSTANSALTAFISSAMGVNGPLNAQNADQAANTLASNMSRWLESPFSTSGQSGQSLIQGLTSDLSNLTTAFNGVSSTAANAVQYWQTQINTMMGAAQAATQGIATSDGVMVHNETGQ